MNDLHIEPKTGYQVVVYNPELRPVDRSWRTPDRSTCEQRATQLRELIKRQGWNYTVRVEETAL